VASAPLIVRLEWRINDVSDGQARKDVEALPAHFDRIDGWIASGTMDAGDGPNAADLQIGSSIALLNTIADLRPILEGRPSLEAALREFPDFPGEIPAGTLPPGWVAAPAPA
jgi:glutathione S-transferase